MASQGLTVAVGYFQLVRDHGPRRRDPFDGGRDDVGRVIRIAIAAAGELAESAQIKLSEGLGPAEVEGDITVQRRPLTGERDCT